MQAALPLEGSGPRGFAPERYPVVNGWFGQERVLYQAPEHDGWRGTRRQVEDISTKKKKKREKKLEMSVSPRIPLN